MTLTPPTPFIGLKPGETPDPKRLLELFDGVQKNFEFLHKQFPIQGANVGNVVKLAEAGSLTVDTGSGTMTMVGGSTLSGGMLFSHSLGGTPVWAHMGIETVSGYAINFECRVVARSTTQIEFQAVSSSALPGEGISVPCFWTALG